MDFLKKLIEQGKPDRPIGFEPREDYDVHKVVDGEFGEGALRDAITVIMNYATNQPQTPRNGVRNVGDQMVMQMEGVVFLDDKGVPTSDATYQIIIRRVK